MSRRRRIITLFVGLVFLLGSVPTPAFGCDTHAQTVTSHGASRGSLITGIASGPDMGGCGMQGVPHACAAMASCAPAALQAPIVAYAAVATPQAPPLGERYTAPRSRVGVPDVPPPRR